MYLFLLHEFIENISLVLNLSYITQVSLGEEFRRRCLLDGCLLTDATRMVNCVCVCPWSWYHWGVGMDACGDTFPRCRDAFRRCQVHICRCGFCQVSDVTRCHAGNLNGARVYRYRRKERPPRRTPHVFGAH